MKTLLVILLFISSLNAIWSKNNLMDHGYSYSVECIQGYFMVHIKKIDTNTTYIIEPYCKDKSSWDGDCEDEKPMECTLPKDRR